MEFEFLIDTDTLMGPSTDSSCCKNFNCVSKSALQSFLTQLETTPAFTPVVASLINDLPKEVKTDRCGHSDLIYLMTKSLSDGEITAERLTDVLDRAKHVIKLYRLLTTAS